MVPAANDGIDRGHAGKPLGGTGALVSGGSDDDISGLSQSTEDTECREHAYGDQSSHDVAKGYGMGAGKIAQAHLTGYASATPDHRVQ